MWPQQPSAAVQILVVMGLLVRIMSFWPAMAGLIVTILLIPLSALIGKKQGQVRKEVLKHTDARVKLCTEVITGTVVCMSW